MKGIRLKVLNPGSVKWILSVVSAVIAGAILHAVFIALPKQRAEEERLEKYSVIIERNLDELIGHSVDLNEFVTLVKSLKLEVVPSKQPTVFANLNLRLGMATYYLADIEETEDNCRRALSALSDPDPADALAKDRDFQGTVHLFSGAASLCLARVRNLETNVQAALEHLAQAAEIFSDTGDKKSLAKAYFYTGGSYRLLGERSETSENFDRAENYFSDALVVHGGVGDRVNRSRILHALGNLHRFRAELTQSRSHLDEAIEAYEDAIGLTPIEERPYDYARFNTSLGVAHYTYAEFFREPDSMHAQLSASQEAHRRALLVRGRNPDSDEFATTMLNLGNTLDTLATILPDSERIATLEESIGAYLQAASVFQVDLQPINFSLLQNNVGIGYARLYSETDDKKYLEKSLEAFRDSLLVRTRTQYPMDFARTTGNMALVYKLRAAADDGKCQSLAEARNLLKEALVVLEDEGDGALGDLSFFRSQLIEVESTIKTSECELSTPDRTFAK